MDLKVISSGSKGNTYLLQDDGNTIILDCGINVKRILAALKYKIESVVCCMVTHEHNDHSKAAVELGAYGIPLLMSNGTWGIVGGRRAIIARHNEVIQIGNYSILPFNTKHDCAEPLGFLVTNNTHKILYATDTYNIPYKFNGLTHIIIECNYCVDLLLENISKGRIPPMMKKRIMYAHLSLDSCIKFLKTQDLSSCRKIILVHLSDGNSDAQRMVEEVSKATGIETIAAEDGQEINFDLFSF